MKSIMIFAVIAVLTLTACGSGSATSDVVLENIRTRTSIRTYTAEKVSEDDIETLLRAAMAAPCAKNRQLWEFVVVDDRATLDSLAGGLRFAKMLTKAPLAIIVCVRDTFPGPNGETCIHDCWQCDGAVAAENILLAAHSIGLGAVYTAANDEERSACIRSVLGIPSEVHPVCVIPVGHPADNPEPKDKWKPEKIHRNKY